MLYIGPDATNPGLPHVWSQVFAVQKNDSFDGGTDPGDGTIPSSASVPDAALSTVIASPASPVADGTNFSTVTVTMLGKNGTNTAPVAAGTTVTLTPTSGSSKVAPTTATTDANGVATFQVSDVTPETVHYQASADSVTVAQQAQVTFAAPTVSATASKVTTAPGSVAADGTAASTVTVTIRDQGIIATPLAGQSVTLTQNSGASSQIQTLSGTTDNTGSATFSVTDSTVEQVTYSAHAGGVTVGNTAGVTFGTLMVSAGSSTVVATQSPAVIGAGGGTTVTVTLLTIGGASPVAGKTISLSASSSSASVSPTTGVSDANGQFAFGVTDTVPESVTYTAKDMDDNVTVTATATVVFQTAQAATASATLSSVTIQPSTVIADATTPSTFFVTVRDTNSQPLPNKVVTIAPTTPNLKVTITPVTPPGVNESPARRTRPGWLSSRFAAARPGACPSLLSIPRTTT